MSNDTNAALNGKAPAPGTPEALAALALLFGDSVKQLVTTAEAQQTAILGMTAILALTPGTANIDPKRLGVIVQALTMGRKDADRVREQVAAYVSMVVGLAGKLPDIMADAEKAERANGSGKSKSN